MVFTADGKIVIAKRAGMNAPDTGMTMPAGSWYTGEKANGQPFHKLDYAIRREIVDETGLPMKRSSIYKVEGPFGMFKEGQTIGLTFEIYTSLTESQIRELWEKQNKINPEHSDISFFNPVDIPDLLANHLQVSPSTKDPLVLSAGGVLIPYLKRHNPSGADYVLEKLKDIIIDKTLRAA